MVRVPAEPRRTAGRTAGRSVVPLTVIAGSDGAGKTTLLSHLLRNSAAQRIAALVNDLDALVVDDGLVRRRASDTLTLTNGCLCRRLVGEVGDALADLRRRGRGLEHVLVEADRLTGPEDIAQFGSLPGYRLDGVITVTDAEAIRSQAADPDLGGNAVGQLLTGDLVVLNKADLVSRAELDSVCDWLKELIPNTRVVEASYGRLPPSLVLGRHPTGDARQERRADGPRRAVERHPHEVGYFSWSWVGDEPINDAGFQWWAATLPEGIVRGRGILHLRSDPASRFVFDLIGSHWTIRRDGPWRGEPCKTTVALLGRAGSFRPGWLEMTIRRCTGVTGRRPSGEPTHAPATNPR